MSLNVMGSAECGQGASHLRPPTSGLTTLSHDFRRAAKSVLFRFYLHRLPPKVRVPCAAWRPSVVAWARPAWPVAARGVRWSRSAARWRVPTFKPGAASALYTAVGGGRCGADGAEESGRPAAHHAARGAAPPAFGFRGGRVRQAVRRGREARVAVHGASLGLWGPHPRATGVWVAAMARPAVNRSVDSIAWCCVDRRGTAGAVYSPSVTCPYLADATASAPGVRCATRCRRSN
jgi:hypothetical protein